MQIRYRRLLPLCVAALLTACSGGGGGTSPQNGTLSLAVTDAPVDSAAAAVVKFTAIELKPENGAAFTLDLSPAQSIDLLTLTNGATATLLDEQSVPAGRYEFIRLMVEAEQNQTSSYIDLLTGERFPLFIPSGSQTGLKLVRGFTVAVGGNSDFTIDFDLRKSVIAPPGQAPNYFLKPALRLVDNLQVGSIAGTVAASRIAGSCTPFVYLFSGAGVTPDDMDAAVDPDVDPLISVPVELDSSSAQFRYRITFLEAGSYTVAFTCDGALDTAEGEETLNFTGVASATVIANQETTLEFGEAQP